MPRDVFGRIFSSDYGASATTSGLFLLNDASIQSSALHRASLRSQFALWLVVAPCLFVVSYGGDPGLGIWLVPVAALMLFYSVARIALDLSKQREAQKCKK